MACSCLLPETCRCTEYLSVSIVPSDLNSLTEVISDLVTSTCGRCKGYINGDTTKLIFAGKNQTTESPVSFPVAMTKTFGNTAYNKFVPIIKAPGVVVVRRRGIDNNGLLTKVSSNSVFDAWPVFLFTLLAVLLAGIVVWILVSNILMAISTLYRIALVPAPKTYRMGLSFTHKTPISDRFFVPEQCGGASVLKENRHISDRCHFLE